MNRHWKLLGTAPLALLLFANTVKGQVSFLQPPTFAGSGQVFEADFNGDGKPDLLSSDGTLQLGKGDGTFTTGTPVTGTPLAVADFNGDGKPDILEQGTGTLLVLLGNGDGTFQAPISTNSGAALTVVAAADLSGNGKADVVGVFNNTLLVYLSHSDGTFAAGVSYSLGSVQIFTPTLIVFGDFNGDHKTDVAVLSPASSTLALEQEIVLLGNGDGTFQSTPLASMGATGVVLSVVAGDFNGDGKLDLSTSELVNGGNIPAATVSLQLGNGDGTFQAATTAFTAPYFGEGSGGAEATALAAADLNGDGKSDLIFAADLIGIYLSNGDGTFSTNYYQPIFSGLVGIAIADFNVDGKPDIAVDGEILLGYGNGTFQGPAAVLTPSYVGTAVVGQFVNKGAPGVAAIPINNDTFNTLYIWTNDGTGILSLAHTYALPQTGYVIATADVNADGNLDLVVEGADAAKNWSYIVLLGNGDGSFQTPVLYQQNTQATNLAAPIVIADFNNDHKLDLAFTQGNQTFAVLLGNGDGTFGAPTYVFDGDGGPIVSADFNGDGNLDIAEAGPSGLAIVLGNGTGTFQPAAFPSTTALFGLLADDLNGDGKADLIGNSSPGIQVFLGNGDGTFNALAPFSSASTAIALADFNGDGKLDVVTRDAFGATETNGIFLGNGDGTFAPSEFHIPYSYPPHSLPPVVQVADMNGDGTPDLIVETPVSTMFVLLDSTAPGFELSATALSPGTITAGSSATSTMSITPIFGFSGMVTLSCSMSPIVSPPPTCSLSSSSVQISGSPQSVKVTVGTMGPVGAGTVSPVNFPSGAMPLGWTAILLAGSGLLRLNRKRLLRLAAPLVVLALVSWTGCGGGGASPTQSMPGTPAGTYTATVTATSGSVTHTAILTVIVQ